MNPDLEVVQIRRGESFKAWAHGYPFHTVRWHFHPEYEIHHVVATTGRYFVGDFIGEFEPGNLVLTGPNLPHNWVSDVPAGSCVPLRGRVVQFSEEFIADATAALPELAACAGILELSRRGALFSTATAELAGPVLAELVEAQGMRRIALFMTLMDILSRAADVQPLTSAGYLPDPSGFMSAGINQALAYINARLTEPFSESDLAAIAGRSPSAFSRSFRRHTGMALVQYVNRLRINLACQLLMSEAQMSITEICYAAGYNNISNFNRQFLVQKGMSPSRFRALLAENISAEIAA
ncbi:MULTISPECIES: AraC family transcriptional regulator [unclassified Mesorhizobium]|uniref:AraC family transcriptional regulator n=1 Tax=unclassified Mesorhizobium TaxID=325217 RepID=UPI000FD9F2B2|nr:MULTISPECIES: AraC family transcriptional regulator [unclassified Mesorhizobium]TGQ34699.1 AraC family transcriptional regulator [Mesorhizobium sp. M00.F.Ca.ET.216.01.1.1]TIS57569.1 MAG: helix-turn-helix domain-containing protein [Mesorhizobium sp.]TIS88653.1 MAG: helix-turn-helix domain-containing protein [Mesorhizobium sp.]TJW07297.1 MAG: helix-turn-helix domain-containing protein [Mesorhizobium sp.]